MSFAFLLARLPCSAYVSPMTTCTHLNLIGVDYDERPAYSLCRDCGAVLSAENDTETVAQSLAATSRFYAAMGGYRATA